MAKKSEATKTAQGILSPKKQCSAPLGTQISSKIPDLRSMGSKINFEQIIQNLKKTSFTKQLLLGAASGWITGVATMKVGKFATCAVGSGILIYQIAQHHGLITIDWNEVRNKAEQKKLHLAEKYKKEPPKSMVKLRSFAKGNRVFTAAFFGGFLLGLGS